MTVGNEFIGADAESILFGEASERRRASARPVAAALGALRRLSAEVHSAEVERAAVRAVSDFVLERLRADRVTTALATWDGCLEVVAVSARGPAGKAAEARPDPHMRRAVATRKTIAASGAGLPAVLVVPLVVGGRAIGGIGVERSGVPRAFDEVEALMAEIAGDLLAGRIETLRLAAKA